MAKCKKCGKALLLGGIRLSDAVICRPCLNDLGFGDRISQSTAGIYRWDDVKDGISAYWDRQNAKTAASMGLALKHYKQLLAASSTDLEEKLFAAMCAIWDDEGCDVSRLDIAPGDRGSLLVLLNETVVLEYKGEPRVRWILFPDSPDKVRIGNSARINSLAKRITAAYRSAE